MTVSNRRLSLFGCRREPVDETELTTVQIAVASQGVGEGKIGGGGCIAYALFKLGVFLPSEEAVFRTVPLQCQAACRQTRL